MAMWDQATSPFGEVRGQALSYFENTFQNVTANIVGDYADMIHRATKAIADTKVYRLSVAAARKLRYFDTTDEIRELFCVGEIQNAPDCMEALLVALPNYRELYNKGMAAGYENGFSQHDNFRGSAIGLTDFHFRTAIEGVASTYSEHMSWTFNNAVNDRKLAKPDQLDVQKTWDYMLTLDWEEEDPMSQFNASVG